MKIFKHRHFCKWAKSEKLTDSVLVKAIEELNQGLFGANLGGGLYKKRVARSGKGKRTGYRTLIAFKQNDKAIFVYGFGKNKKSDISLKEREIYKDIAKYYLNLAEQELNKLLVAEYLVYYIEKRGNDYEKEFIESSSRYGKRSP